MLLMEGVVGAKEMKVLQRVCHWLSPDSNEGSI